MVKVNFTPLQQIVFDEFAAFPALSKKYYFTGGTALSVFYLGHRYSDDLDFFTQGELDDQIITEFLAILTKKIGKNYRATILENTRMFEFGEENQTDIKVDFAKYPYPLIEKGIEEKGVKINSLRDLAANKFLTISQRTSVKDFVDLYYLLKKYTLWDLIYGLEAKFHQETDLILLSSDFLKVEDFEFLPKMILPLTLPELKAFFKEKAREIAQKVTTK